MVNPQNEKATGQGGFSNVVGGQAKSTKQKTAVICNSNHISKVVGEVESAGFRLRNSSGGTQLATLPKVLEYLGARGLSTYEGVALGYCRIATRVLDLKDEYEIATVREDTIGPDGLLHKGIARYVLIGKRTDAPRQGQLELEVNV